MALFNRTMKEQGIMGINARNLECVFPHNPRALYPRVDDKLQTKLLAQQAGINVPPLYHTVEYQEQIKKLPKVLAPYDSFAVKPAKGSGGNGVMILTRNKRREFVTPDGHIVPMAKLQFHLL